MSGFAFTPQGARIVGGTNEIHERAKVTEVTEDFRRDRPLNLLEQQIPLEKVFEILHGPGSDNKFMGPETIEAREQRLSDANNRILELIKQSAADRNPLGRLVNLIQKGRAEALAEQRGQELSSAHMEEVIRAWTDQDTAAAKNSLEMRHQLALMRSEGQRFLTEVQGPADPSA